MRAFFIIGIFCLALSLPAQGVADADTIPAGNESMFKNKRASITSFMMYHPEDTLADEIYNAYISCPFPDNFNNHNLKYTNMSFAEVTDDQGNGLYKEEYGDFLNRREIEYNGKVLESYLNRMKIPTLMVAKWFNFHGNDSTGYAFDMSLVRERGFYDSNLLTLDSIRKNGRAIADANKELISNTYVVVNDMSFISGYYFGRPILWDPIFWDFIYQDSLKTDEQRNQWAIAIINEWEFSSGAVRNNSYLLRLEWNDSIASKFYNDYYTETWDSTKIVSFLADTTTFRLKYVTNEMINEFKFKGNPIGKYDREQVVKIRTARSIDNNIAGLQKRYRDFKAKFPITEVLYNDKGKITGYAARIGTKEGINKDSKFIVVRESFNPETGRTEYKRIAKIKVKGEVWNNKYMAAEDREEGTDLKYTVMKKTSGGKIYPGMWIMEIGNKKTRYW